MQKFVEKPKVVVVKIMLILSLGLFVMFVSMLFNYVITGKESKLIALCIPNMFVILFSYNLAERKYDDEKDHLTTKVMKGVKFAPKYLKFLGLIIAGCIVLVVLVDFSDENRVVNGFSAILDYVSFLIYYSHIIEKTRNIS